MAHHVAGALPLQQVTERTSGLLEGMIRALDYRDTETQWHSWRVARFSLKLLPSMAITSA